MKKPDESEDRRATVQARWFKIQHLRCKYHIYPLMRWRKKKMDKAVSCPKCNQINYGYYSLKPVEGFGILRKCLKCEEVYYTKHTPGIGFWDILLY